MDILINCEFSGVVREAFRAKGHNAVSCDLLPTEIPGPHIIGDAIVVARSRKWDAMIAFPPCTRLTLAGVRWLNERDLWDDMRRDAAFFLALKNMDHIPRIALENSQPHSYAMEIIGRYDWAMQPWEHGEPFTKRACIWTKNMVRITPTDIVPKHLRKAECHMATPGPDRWKERSRTKPGIARVMAEFWG